MTGSAPKAFSIEEFPDVEQQPHLLKGGLVHRGTSDRGTTISYFAT